MRGVDLILALREPEQPWSVAQHYSSASERNMDQIATKQATL